MKARVIREYTDKFTGDLMVEGMEIEVNKKRAKELMGENTYKKQYIELIEDVVEKKHETK